jgi:hypothetical protein
MKHLAILAAALLLAGAPAAFAQEGDPDGNNGTNNGGGTGDTGGTDAGNNNNDDSATGSTSAAGNDSDCPEMTPGLKYESFSAKCRNAIDIWAEKQAGASVVFEGDVAVGTVLPDTVEFVEVPAYRGYGYVMLNDRRVLVDRDTRTVVRVF